MADIKDQLIKDSYNYVLQSDLSTGVVYRIGGAIPINPIFSSGLTINSGFTFSNGTEQNGYVLFTDANGNAYWGSTTGITTSGLTYYVSASTPTGISFINGDRWFDTTTGDETVWINDGVGMGQWVQPNNGGGGGGGSPYSGSGISNFLTIWNSTYGLTASTIQYNGSQYLIPSLSSTTIYSENYQGNVVTDIQNGSYISVSQNTGSVTINNDKPDLDVTFTIQDGVSVAGVYPNFDITNTDKGSSQNIFKNIKINGNTQFSSSSNNDSLNFSGIGVTITSGTNNTLIFSAGTSSQSVSGDYLPLSGGTVTGATIFQSGLTANTISATTYFNLPVSGLTSGSGIGITNNNNNNFTISYTGSTGITGDYLPLSGGTVTGATIFQSGLTANTLSATSISATNYYGLPTDVFVTGGTYANGTLYLTNNTGHTFNVPGFSTATGNTNNYYGSFSDTTTQVVNGVNTPTAWSANTTEISNGIYIVDGSKITVSNNGIYEIGYSAQIEKTVAGGDAIVTIWAKLNGNNIDRSSSTITLPNQSAYQLPFVSYIFDLYAGDQIEFYFSSTVAGTQITTLSGLVTPTRPVSPSLILVAKAIGNAVLSNSGDSYVTGFTLTNNNLLLSQNRVGQYSGFTVNLPYLNTSGGTIFGDLNVTGSTSASTYYGYGGYLTGISRGGGGGAGGQLYYFNISNFQTPYYEFSTTATTVSEQTITVTTGASQTAYVGGFMTPSGSPGITNFPAGILSFYLHCYDGNNHNFNIYCELYKRTVGGSETLLFTSDPVAVVNSTPEMVISDGFFSGTTLNNTDRLVVKIYATNISNQTRSLSFLSEGSQHYSFALTTIPSYTDTYVTGFTYSNNTFTIKQNNNQPDLTRTINSVTGLTINGDLTITGTTTSGVLSATTYQNLPVSGLTSGNNIGITNNNNNNFTISFTGGSISSSVNFTNGLTANTISATTITAVNYNNLPSLYQLTGGTYSTGTIDFKNTTGGTSFSVTGLSKYFVTGSTPTGITLIDGDRWFNSTDGVELVYITDINGSQWIQPNNGGTNSGSTSVSGDYLPLSGGTVTGNTVFQSGLTVNTLTTFNSGFTHNNSIDVDRYSGEVVKFGGGSTYASSLYYYNSSGTWTSTDANSTATSTGMLGIGISNDYATAGSPSTNGILVRGFAKLYYGSWTTGDKLYVADDASSEITNIAPTASGYVVRVIGYVVDGASSLIYFCPDNTWVQLV